MNGETDALRAGQLLYLQGGVVHDVTALEGSSVQVTVALCG